MNKKIFFLLPTLHQASSAKVLGEFISHFQNKFDVRIVVFENHQDPNRWGCPIIDLRTPFSLHKTQHFANFFLRCWRFFLVIRREKPDYVISSMDTAHFLNCFLNRKHAILRMVIFFSKGNRGLKRYLFGLFMKIFFPRAKKIVVLSHAMKEDLVNSYGIQADRVQVIYSPINVQKVQGLSRENLPPEYEKVFQYPVVLSIGRLTKQKGQWHIVKAFSRLKGVVSDAKLIILGDGDLKEFLVETAKRFHLENDVYFPGWDQNPFRFLRRSKLFVLASRVEGLPNVLLEAAACGVPIVSTDCKSGPREILAPSTPFNRQTKDMEYTDYGILVPVDESGMNDSMELRPEEEILAEAMIEAMTNEELAKKFRANLQTRAEDFRTEKAMREWEQILQ